jgi:hypothetical protein
VRTPSGAFAVIVRDHPEQGEATVQWGNGEVGRFRYSHLRAMPGADE